MALFQINYETCTKCGICAAVCPVSVILEKDGFPEPHRAAESICLKCGHCVAVCPTSSLIHQNIPIEQCPPVKKNFVPDLEQITQLIRSRRSVRSFQDKAVARELITRAIETGRYGPTSHNDQTVNWLVLDSPQEIKKITGIGFNWMRWMMENQPTLSSYFVFRKLVKEYESGIDKFLRNAPVVVLTHAGKKNALANIDCVCAMSYFNLAAVSLGLGCCWAGFLQVAASTFSPMIEALHIPEDNRVFGSMMVGYQRYSYQRMPERKPPQITWR